MTLKLGALRFLNALPLVAQLEKHPSRPRVSYEIPSLLARDLRAGAFDLALVPVVESMRDPNYRIVPGPCVSCLGPVDSILLFSTQPLSQIRTIGVDLSSNTSVELLRVLFHLRGLPAPELTAVPPRLDRLRTQDPLDAVLLIGDPALAEDHGEFPRFDLGALWHEATGLPFVFAAWVGQANAPREAIDCVTDTLAANLPRRDELAESFTREYPGVIDVDGARRYLTTSIRYSMGDAECTGLERFHALRAELGDVDANWRPRFFEGPC